MPWVFRNRIGAYTHLRKESVASRESKMYQRKRDQRYMVTILLLVTSLSYVTGFAYAPNFITKIIAEETGKVPVGLLELKDINSDEASITTVAEPTVPGPIMTRFPPEPNGYLHLGHAKAVSFNFAVARMFGGSCNMRLDDTNPTKEDEEYVDSILEDVRWIQSGLYDSKGDPWSGPVRTTSDNFAFIYDCAVALIKQGDAYVDSLSADEMREYRGSLSEPGKNSPYRNRSVEESIELFSKMKEGKCKEGEHIVRAKINMSSPNMNMRDPALFRIKHESHQNTGDAWCIYPMYDFSHPIVDAIEGITHSLCTLEFEDHRPFYEWLIEKLTSAELLTASPRQIEFSRLNIKYTVLSKRKLIQLVEQKHVSGWDDPRMPTLSGVRRRGVPPAALRLFCERVGISKADSNIDFQVLEDCTRDEMDELCPRAFCVLKPLKVTITNWDDPTIENFSVPRHPKNVAMGDRVMPFGKELYIERSDFFDLEGPEGVANGKKIPRGFKRLLPNEKVRLKFAYVITCDEIVRDLDTNEPIELRCSYMPETRAGAKPEGMSRVKGIIQWVEASTGVTCQINQYDRLFDKEEPGKENGDYTQDINPNSLETLKDAVVEPSVGTDALAILEKIRARSGDNKLYHSTLSYQFERTGYFALDQTSTGIDNLVLNRVVTLRDTWGVDAQDAAPSARKRGEGDKSQKKQKGGSGDVVEDIRRVALRAGTILEVGRHPEADNLLVCKVDCGDVTESNEPLEPRTVVAGLAGKIPIDELVGKKIVCATNLKPSKMRGIESTAMLLAASNGKEGDDEKVELLGVQDSVANGELLSFEGKEPSEPDIMMKSKGALKAWDRAKTGLKVNESGEAAFIDGDVTHRMMTSAGPAKTTSLASADIQ